MSKELDNNSKVNLVFLLADIQEQYMLELEKEVNYQFKQEVKAISSRCKKLIRFVDNALSEEGQSQFGDTSDELRQKIELIYLED